MNSRIQIIEHDNWSVDIVCGEKKVHFPPTEATEKKVLSEIEKWMQPEECRLKDDDIVTLCVMHNTRLDEFHFLIHDDYNNGLFVTSYEEMEGFDDYDVTLANIRYEWNKKFKECIEYIQQHANNHYNEGHVRLWKSSEPLMKLMAQWNISEGTGMDMEIELRKTVAEWNAIVEKLQILPVSLFSLKEIYTMMTSPTKINEVEVEEELPLWV